MKKGIIFITRSQLSFFGSNLPAVAVLNLPSTIFQDIEIVNKEEFEKTLISFFDTNKIEPSQFIQIFNNDLLFSKEISLQETSQSQPQTSPVEGQSAPATAAKPTTKIKDEETIKKEIDEFLSVVPFEESLIMTQRKEKKPIIVYVANKNLSDTITGALSSKGFISQGVTSPALIGQNPIASLDPHTGAQFLSNYNTLLQNTFPITLNTDKIDTDDLAGEEEKPSGSNNTKMIAVLLVLLLVLGGLGYVLWSQFNTKPTKANVSATPTPAAPSTASPSASLAPTASASPSATLQERTTRIQVLNGSGIPGQADQVRNDYTKIGFANVVTGNASGQTLAKTLVVFNNKVPTATRDKIVAVLQTRYKDVSVNESTETDFDAVITIIPSTPTLTSKPVEN